MLIILSLLLVFSSAFLVSQPCISALPYKTTNINLADYESWYGKEGENINGTTYLCGHVFSRHIAVDNKCTSEQKAEQKTVFWDLN